LVSGAATAPTINNIPTVNITNLAAGSSLNLGASTGVTTLGDVNSVADVAITGARTALTTLNKSGGISRSTEVIFQNNVLTGSANAVAINLDGIDGGNIRLESGTPTNTNGYETFNVNAVSASSIGRLISGGSLDNINVSGANLSIRGSAGQDALERQLTNFNASAQTGSLTVGRINNGVTLSQAVSVVNAAAEDLNFVGSNNGTTLFVDSASLAQGDVLNGGAGAGGNLVLTGNGGNGVVQGNNSAFAATGFETLTITDTAGNGVAARTFINPANFNLANVSGVNTLELGTASNAVVGLTNFNYTNPLAINVTGNGETSVNAANGVNAVFFGAFGDADTVNYTFSNRGTTLNSNNSLDNGELRLPNIENISLTYNNLSSNTRLTREVFSTLANATDAVRFLSVSSASGDDDLVGVGLLGAINLGTIGTAGVSNEFRGGTINSNASVSGIFANRGGASIAASGAGDLNLAVTARDARDASINASAGTGDQRLAAADIANATGRLTFTSGSGTDTLIGGSANDVLTGNSGDDLLDGNNGIDVLSGGDNNDTLIGGNGNDVLTGGGGVDTFRYSQSLISDVDIITDFAFGAGGDSIGYTTGAGFNAVVGTNATAITLSQANGDDITAAAQAVVATFGGGTATASIGSASTFLVLTNNATSFAAAIGTAGASVGNTSLGTAEAIATVYFNTASNEAVFGFITNDNSATSGILNSSDNFTEIGRATSTAAAFSGLAAANVNFF
jgi:hypothetical protein